MVVPGRSPRLAGCLSGGVGQRALGPRGCPGGYAASRREVLLLTSRTANGGRHMTPTPPSGTTPKVSARTERPPVAVIILGAGVMSFSALNMIRLSLRHDPQVHVPTPIV